MDSDANASEILEQLSKRIEVEQHGDQTGFKCMATFADLETLTDRIPEFTREENATPEEEGLRLAHFINSSDLLEQIGQGILRQSAANPATEHHEFASSVIQRIERLIEAGSDLRPMMFYYVCGGFSFGLAYFIAIDDRFWDDSQLAIPEGEQKAAAGHGPHAQVEACNDVVRHAMERNKQYQGLYVLSGFLPHSSLQTSFPEFENPQQHTGRELSQSLAAYLQESGDIYRVVAGLLQNIADNDQHDDREMAKRIFLQIREDLAENQYEFRKPLHYVGGNAEGLAIAVAIDDRFWTTEW